MAEKSKLRLESISRRTVMKTSAVAGFIGLGSGSAVADKKPSSPASGELKNNEKVTVSPKNHDDATALVIKDRNPWGERDYETNGENEEVLQELGVSYDVSRSDTLSQYIPDLDTYDLVVIASDQREPEFFSRVLNFRNDILRYVENGGVLVAHTLTNRTDGVGWPSELLPDGINTFDDFGRYAAEKLSINLPDHPVVSNVTDEELDDWRQSTHGHYTQLPDDGKSVITKTNEPEKHTYIEYEYGSGTILATEIAIEWRGIEKAAENGEKLLKSELKYAHNIETRGGEEPSLFDLTVDAPSEAVAGSDVTISVDAEAAESQISAFQIAPDDYPDHTNDFSDLTVTTTDPTQIETPSLIAYRQLQEQVTTEWTGAIPENAEAGETFTLAGDALDGPQNRQLFSHTVTVTDDPLAEYRNQNGEVDDTGLLEAISDWRNGELEDTQLLQLISEWRDAGGNVEALPVDSLPNVK